MKYVWYSVLPLLFVIQLPAACVTGGFAVVVNRANGIGNLSLPQLRKIITGEIRNWPDRKAVVIVNREPQSQVFRCMLSAVIGLSEPEYRRKLMNEEFRGEEAVPVRVTVSTSSAVLTVGDIEGGITLIEASIVSRLPPSAKVIRINGAALGEAGYPL